LIQNSSDVVMVINEELETLYMSPSLDRVFGASGSTPGTLEGLVHPLDAPSLKRAIKEATKRGNSDPIECRFRGRGEWVDAELIATDLRSDPDVNGVVLNARDVSERKRLEARLHHQSFHDPLTGLANRSLFADRAKHALALSRRRGEAVSVLFLDLDDFKRVNETKGHPAGDTILKRVAERLAGCIRPSDTVGRMDGDEFALLLEDTDAEGAKVVARRVSDALSGPIEVEDGSIIVSACVGIATTIGDEASVEDLLRRADLAMHTAKRQNRGRVEVFEPGTFNDILRRFELEFEIERAIDEGEFYLEYQPIFDIRNSQLWGVEALVRWRHPTQGTIPPEDFITSAESTGAIVALERLVIREACNQGVRWIEAGRPVTVSVNLSPRHLADRGIVPAITTILSTTGMPPSLLMLEITEGVMADDSTHTIAKIQELKKLGIRVALDDFGTGYSSLSVLQNLPIDVLKVDKTFIEPLGGSDNRSILAPALLRIAATLDLLPVAEGIETEEQLQELKRLGCTLGQGFHLGRPVAPNELFLLTDPPIGPQVPAPTQDLIHHRPGTPH
jgi:diguanylate cyclase (GGDEF)-like protein/PAS domain S-box-containing protein